MKELHSDAIDRGVEALGRFRRIADTFGAEVHAVAPSAVREAETREDFLEAALAKANIKIEVISGVEEARLIHLGVLQAVPVFDQQVLVVDIGGGSTEFIVGKGGDMLAARSLKVGAIRLTERFSRKGAKPSSTADGRADVVDALASRPRVADRLAVPGLDPRRADIILGGVIVLEQVVRGLGIDELVTSDFALREGVLLDVVRRRQAGTLGHLRDLRCESRLPLAALPPGGQGHCSPI